MAGLWEFPGGKKEKGETLCGALRRELREELGVDVAVGRQLLKVRHSYTRFQVMLAAFECELLGTPSLQRGRRRWVSIRAMKSLPFPSGSAKIVRFLEEAQGREPRDSPTV
jgi:mutator protein MutT